MTPFFDTSKWKAGFRVLLGSRTFAILVAGVFVAIVLFKVALPLFVSTASVKTNMERALSSWTGARASISGDPEISFWPHPVLTLRNVTFEGGETDTPHQLATADAIAAGFDILAALRGTPVFYDFHLVNPAFTVERRTDGSFNWRRAGWMADAVANASSASPSTVRNIPIGDITIDNGSLDLIDRMTDSAYRVKNISGSVQWQTPTARMSASLSALMNGQKVEWSLICDEPLMLLSGHNSAIQTSFTSTPLSFAFDGTGNGSDNPFVSGQLQLSARSVPTVLAWRDAQALPGSTAEALAIDTSMTMSGGTMKMDNLSLSLGGDSATGVLDIAWFHRNGPRVDGTLAFDRIDLTSLVASVLPLQTGSGMAGKLPDVGFLKQIGFDLRLSAQEAAYGPVALTDIAAGIMAENGRLSIDIGDATYSGGSLSGRLALAGNGADGGQLQASLQNADLGALAAGFGLGGPLPLGRGLLSVDLSTKQPLSAITLSGVSGEVRYQARDGVLTNFNAPEFERLASARDFFPASQASDGSFAFTTAEIVATLKRGEAELVKADIRGDGKTLSFAGVVPYHSGGLALAGAIRPDDTTLKPVRFFIGGSWPNPVISPLSAIPAEP
ncbi:AsmA family protein [Pararhizobium sp. O133]|uniref:AsmA family protein n=1 Tax=Pararhizobium sp. O133 TaxID=3449278 RepID=UPI003F687C68